MSSALSQIPRSQPVRVGFVISDLLGFATYTANLRESLRGEPAIAPHWLPVPPAADDLWQKVPQFSMRMALRASAMMRRERHNVDALFVCTQILGMFSLGLMRRVPTVISLDATPRNFDEVVDAYGRAPPGKVSGALKHRWNVAVFDAAARVVAWNDWIARSLIGEYQVPPEKVALIRQGIDLSLWAPVEKPARTGPVRLLFVGGDFERKGGNDLLAVHAALRARCEVDIVSNSPAVQGSEGVRVHRNLGPNSEPLRALFRDADVFLLPSHGDAAPWVVLEAMASGLPVVATRVGGIPEMVLQGETGLLVERRDRPALTQALEALLGDPARRKQMGAAGRARVEQLFDARKNDRQLFQLMQELPRRR